MAEEFVWMNERKHLPQPPFKKPVKKETFPTPTTKQLDFLVKHCGYTTEDAVKVSRKYASTLITLKVREWKEKQIAKIPNTNKFDGLKEAFNKQQERTKMRLEALRKRI